MQQTLIRRAQYGLEHDSPVSLPRPRPREPYKAFRSSYGPNYKLGRHFYGINGAKALRLGTVGAGFGVCAGIFALFFFGGVPRVRKDILQKIPVIGDYFVHEVAPEDNPF